MPERFLLTEANIDNLVAVAQRHLSKYARVLVTFTQPGESRSSRQNDMIHGVCRQIAAYMTEVNQCRDLPAVDVDEVKEYFVTLFYGQEEVTVGSKTWLRPYKTSKMARSQACDMIEQMLAWAAHRDIQVGMPPEWAEWAKESKT